jgi:hypothetical protein
MVGPAVRYRTGPSGLNLDSAEEEEEEIRPI